MVTVCNPFAVVAYKLFMSDIGGECRLSGRRWLWVAAGFFILPGWMYTDQAARAALQSGLLTAVAALTAVAGALIALDETRQAHAEVRRANAEIRRANETIRLGGIYALERIAMDSPAWLNGADLSGVRGLSQRQLETARGDEETRLPEGLVRPVSWSSGNGNGRP